ncbi:type VI secretion system protein TssL, short form [Citrobacter werkmanii]|uniref:type VI secretion system protein TssL, short form n=1 Tax=Citrobacter werkmanii TaxID=67827 RepID=UPI00264F04C5|nr:type VI secretion system protein TssL, short form [Citrobacter werkmanii]MDN8559101.1 type VI secretion system protein TssL, short form [Citrobacter werkmanii]
MKTDINIDVLLADIWLTVTGLRQGARLKDGEGEPLWQHSVDNLERAMTTLERSEVSDISRQHILYALCALLDETAKGRDGEDDACIVWYDRPLEVKYFGTMAAGDALYERMRQVLRDAATDNLVLTCFQRVLMLGFKGSSSSLNDPVRKSLLKTLTERVPVFDTEQHRPVLATVPAGGRLRDWLQYWPVCIGLSAIAVAGLWLGLNHWLDVLIGTLLPGVGQ